MTKVWDSTTRSWIDNSIETIKTLSTDNSKVLKPDGYGGINFSDINPERIPEEMIFTEVHKRAWFDGYSINTLCPSGARWVTDDFSDTSTSRFTTFTESTTGSFSISGGSCTITLPSSGGHSLFLVEGQPINMPQVFVSTTLTATSGTNGSYLACCCGIIKDSNNYIVINHDKANSAVSLQMKIAGTSTFSSGYSTSSWGALPYKFGLCIVGNYASIFVYYSSSWKFLFGYTISAINLKTQDLSTWYGCIGAVNPGTYANTVTFDDFYVGRYGGVGMRDGCIVTNEDGTPYTGLGANKFYMLGTIAAVYGGIEGSSMGSFVVDTKKKTIDLKSVIMCSRDGVTQPDHAGHAIRYNDGYTRICFSSWGDVNSVLPKIRHKYTNVDILNNSTILTNTDVFTGLTNVGSTIDQYDPFLIKKDNYWYLAYTCQLNTTAYTFFPCLDKSSDLTTWTSLGKDTSALRYEGTRILKFNNVYYVLTGGQYNMKIYDLDMNDLGYVNIVSPGDGTTQPHPMIFPSGNLYWLVTFDATKWPSGGNDFSWGSIRMFASPRY